MAVSLLVAEERGILSSRICSLQDKASYLSFNLEGCAHLVVLLTHIGMHKDRQEKS